MAKTLLIDDDALLLETMTFALEIAGHTVFSCTDGRAGLRLIEREHPDVLITDIFMPEMDGLEVLRRARYLRPQMAIIVMSGGSILVGEDYLELAQPLGATAILRKPFRPETLVELISEVLGRANV